MTTNDGVEKMSHIDFTLLIAMLNFRRRIILSSEKIEFSIISAINFNFQKSSSSFFRILRNVYLKNLNLYALSYMIEEREKNPTMWQCRKWMRVASSLVCAPRRRWCEGKMKISRENLTLAYTFRVYIWKMSWWKILPFAASTYEASSLVSSYARLKTKCLNCDKMEKKARAGEWT